MYLTKADFADAAALFTKATVLGFPDSIAGWSGREFAQGIFLSEVQKLIIIQGEISELAADAIREVTSSARGDCLGHSAFVVAKHLFPLGDSVRALAEALTEISSMPLAACKD